MTALWTDEKKDLYGLCAPLQDGETHFNYGIGILLDDDTDRAAAGRLMKQGYTLWETEPADYAVFQCSGPDGDCLGETWSRFFKEFSPQTGYVQTDDTDYEIYYENGEADLFCELWIPVRKKIRDCGQAARKFTWDVKKGKRNHRRKIIFAVLCCAAAESAA